jgi:hypothetical protein
VVATVETLKVDVVGAVIGLGLKVPVAPAGSPATLRVTAPVKPPLGLTEVV